MKAILELTKTNDEGEIFYRYSVDGTLVWFTQHQESGNIYSVIVRVNEELHDTVSFYIQDGDYKDIYYPIGIDICTRGRFNIDKMDEYISLMQYTKNVATAIMDIFNDGIHKECYNKFHTEA
jgi:hypothetical protein